MSDVTLTQKIKSFEEYYQIKETLLSRLAHEFKTPLLGIIGLSEELEKEISDDPKLQVYCKSIHPKITYINDMSNYVLYLINDVVNYLKTSKHSFKEKMLCKKEKDDANITITKEYFNLQKVLEFCFRILKTLLTCTKEKINFIQPIFESKIEEKFMIFSDHIRLKQILLNLISNAVKFTKCGFIKLNAIIEKLDDVSNTELLKISVEDTGTGLNSDDIKNILVKEKLLGNNSSDNHMGSGLGLSISHGISQLLGGEIHVESECGVGSKFILSLPIQKEINSQHGGSDAEIISNNSLGQENLSHGSKMQNESKSNSTLHLGCDELIDINNNKMMLHNEDDKILKVFRAHNKLKRF